jgi:general secretion pathway protein A
LDFGIADIPQSKAQRIFKLQHFLLSGYAAGQISVLVVDEAHKLSPEVLEEIRLLGNFENARDKLLQILLVGQNELTDILNRDDLRQFKQRISVRLRLEALSQEDVAQYIQHRWTKAGGRQPSPFTPDVVDRIGACSRGIPRVVNVICDNVLMLAFAKNQSTVTLEHLLEAAQDLDLTEPEPATETAAVPGTDPTVVELPPLPTAAAHFSSLERYGGYPQPKPSFWSRWTGKLKPAKA